jgi:cyclophilin family peptidyl-prolyl cis-trans isomerase
MRFTSHRLLLSLCLIAAAGLSACGGKTPTPAAPPLVGQFLDGPVQGLSYRTATLSGTTDASGRFNYRAGETVTFSIGGMDLPAVAAAAVVTPLDVVGTSNLNDPDLVNLLVLLQSLDQNGNLSDGIQIPAAAAQAAAGAAGTTLAQDLSTASVAGFASGAPLRALLDASVDAQRAVTGAQAAIDHFASTLASASPTLAFVSKVTVVKDNANDPDLAYDRPLRLRFEGRNLASGITVTATGACTAMTPVGDVVSTAVDYTCTPNTTGSLAVALKAGTRTLHAYSGTVPEPRVQIATSLGDLTLELDIARAPVTSKNFLRYVDAGYYTNTVFHRVISNFMVQGGGCIVGQTTVSNGGCVSGSSTIRLKGNTFDPIILERTDTTGLSNVAGTVAMARTNVVNSATSQFYINVVNNSGGLDANADPTNPNGYAVFGRVVAGDSTVQAIRFTPVQGSVPLSLPVITSATRIR